MKEIINFFFKLGCLGFGGPIAMIALMENELVQKRRWISAENFARSFAILKVLPGPTATQIAIYLGYQRGGRLGGFLAGFMLTFPAFCLVLAISYYYSQFKAIPHAESLFLGMQIAALVIIGDSVARLAKPYYKIRLCQVIMLISTIVIFIKPQTEPLLILGFGFIGAFKDKFIKMSSTLSVFSFSEFFYGRETFSPEVQNLLWKVFIVCFKAGAFVFGTGLAIIPILEAEVVTHYHWLTHSEFLDGLAIGQITPGPVVITAAFIGYKMVGALGALLATVGIISPAFINVLFILPMFEKRIEGSPRLKDFTLWAFPAVIGSLAGIILKLGYTTVSSITTVILLIICILLFYFKRPAPWLFIPVCGVLFFLSQRIA